MTSSSTVVNAKKYGGNLCASLGVRFIEQSEEVIACFGTKLSVFSMRTGYLVKSIDASPSTIIAFALDESKHGQEAFTLDVSGNLLSIDLR